MAKSADSPPQRATTAPDTLDDLIAQVRGCYASGRAVFPIGGGTSLDYGVPVKAEGVELSLARLNRVLDYPARDMTITVESGITMRSLAHELATQRQQLPIDVPQSDRATLGGVIATNWNGPRRYGLGTVRDYVIGISAVDGYGNAFKGGGRVVKNVAGYDFCKLLTGSLGTLGVITQVTLKVRPLPEQSALIGTSVLLGQSAEMLLAELSRSETSPVSILLAGGPDWAHERNLDGLGSQPDAAYVFAGIEGTEPEVTWMQTQLAREFQSVGISSVAALERGFIGSTNSAGLWKKLVEWPAAGEAELVVKANVRPSGVVPFLEAARRVDEQCSYLSHAGNGIVFVKFREIPKAGLSRALIGQLQPAAAALGGQVVILSNPSGTDMTMQSVWGGDQGTFELMRAVKRKFDPKGILNPGRFVV